MNFYVKRTLPASQTISLWQNLENAIFKPYVGCFWQLTSIFMLKLHCLDQWFLTGGKSPKAGVN